MSQHNEDDINTCTNDCQKLRIENQYQFKLKSQNVLPHLTEIQTNQQYKSESWTSNQGCFVIMERASCDLFDFIAKVKQQGLTINLESFKLIALKLCRSIEFIHQLDISHNDIKQDNFFYYSNNNNDIKIGDFGYSSKSQITTIDEIKKIFDGKNENILSPEILEILKTYQESKQTQVDINLKKADIYNLGLLLFELIYGLSCSNINKKVFYRKFMDNLEQKFDNNNNKIYQFFYPIIKMCLQKQPENRQDINQLIDQLQKL